MKIEKIETIPVSIPLDKFEDDMDKVMGKNFPSFFAEDLYSQNKYFLVKSNKGYFLSNVIVKIFTDEGIIGIGEAACDTVEPVSVVKTMIDDHMAPRLIGKNPYDWKCLIDLVNWDTARGATRFSTSGIDLALYDLIGKALGVPVYTLIGGCWRNKVLATIEVPRGSPEKMAEHCYEYYRKGVRGIKAKIGSNPEKDAECIQAIRQKLGNEISLRADANCGYSVKEAIRFCNFVEKLDVDLELLEQPVVQHDLLGMKEVKDSTLIPISADESAYSLSQVQQIIKLNAVDIINTKCAKASGINGVVQWATLAESAGLDIQIGTEWGLGLKVAAKLHLGGSIKNANPAVEFTEFMIHDLLLKDQLTLKDGYLTIPNDPGLGLELDEDKLEEYRTPGL
jgi:L-alanine-DL-glutamate epimerase-like enolase superfamily enzyme